MNWVWFRLRREGGRRGQIAGWRGAAGRALEFWDVLVGSDCCGGMQRAAISHLVTVPVCAGVPGRLTHARRRIGRSTP